MARADIGRRFILYTSAVSLLPADVAGNPFNADQEPNPDTDTVLMGIGLFQQTKDNIVDESTGLVIVRKATLQVHPTYEPYFQKAYAVKIGQEPGLFEIIGVTSDATRVVTTISLQSRQ